MAQGAGVGGCEGRFGADTSGHDEFGTMESPTGAREGQGLSPPVVRVLDVSFHASQFTPEQWGLIEVDLKRHFAPLQQQSERDRQQNLKFQVNNRRMPLGRGLFITS
jgi:hypothetical protein